MSNYLINTLGYNKRARIIFGEMTDLIREVRCQNSANKLLETAFAEFIATLCLMAGPIDTTESFYIKIAGDHPSKTMTGSLEGTGDVRGFIGEDFEKSICADMKGGSIFGKRGSVTVQRSTGEFGGYTGITEIKYKGTAKNLENYYTQSEQLPTYIQLFIPQNNAKVARGVMLQLLPSESKSIISDFNDVVRQNKDYFFNIECAIDIDNLKKHFMPDLVYMGTKPLHYQCTCTKAMYYGTIFSLSPQEIDEIIKNKETLKANCSMCGKEYLFTHKDVTNLFGISLEKNVERKREQDISL